MAIDNERLFIQRRFTRLQSNDADHDDAFYDDAQSQSSIGVKSRAYTEPAPYSVDGSSVGGLSLPPFRHNR